MRTTFRTVTAIVGISVAAIALSGCGLLPAHEFNDTASLSDSVKSVRIDGNNADVNIEGVVGATDITIEREIHYWGTQRAFDATYEVDGSELVLSGCGNRCSVEYTVELPVGVDVNGRTDNGAIELSAVSNVDVTTSNGSISLDEVTGTIKVTTSNGRIEGEELSGSGIVAKTSNGSITLELAKPQKVKADTSNGSIKLRVPTGSYQVEAETALGGKHINIDNSSSGTYLLDLTTANGSITVDSTDSSK